MEIVEVDGGEWRPGEPPVWLMAIAFCAALLVGLAYANDVQDPRVAHPVRPTPCIEQATVGPHEVSHTWVFCN